MLCILIAVYSRCELEGTYINLSRRHTHNLIRSYDYNEIINGQIIKIIYKKNIYRATLSFITLFSRYIPVRIKICKISKNVHNIRHKWMANKTKMFIPSFLTISDITLIFWIILIVREPHVRRVWLRAKFKYYKS